MNSLYITIGSEMSPQNSQGFYLDVNESDRTVEIRRQENKTSQRVAYWHFGDLEKELHFRRWHPIFLGVFYCTKKSHVQKAKVGNWRETSARKRMVARCFIFCYIVVVMAK